ncbi:MAG: S8 family serine peptidase, partial [Elusimicrobiota bacterium]|nr:S8 family serine peptidase [Elusimicrobiota bacterium]
GKGCILVGASGNGGEDMIGDPQVAYPAAYDNVIAVGATDEQDKRASFSNYGTELDLVAPGVDILSTAPMWAIGSGVITASDGTKYKNDSGTSMACPFVSGVVALLLSKDPNLTFDEVYSKLTESADDVELPGKDIYTGFGRLNAAKALGYRPPIIAKVQNAPNPFNPKIQITKIYIPDELKGTSLKVKIFNLAGERIRFIDQSPTINRGEWDGRNDSNELVADGIYVYVIETDKGKATGKITLIKE